VDALRRRWREGLAAPVLSSLKSGLSPDGIALALAVGAVAGLFPVVGVTTVLGLAVGSALRLNLPVLQAANWAVCPVQLALIVPLARVGSRLAPTLAAGAPVEPPGWRQLAQGGLQGILGWLALLPILLPILYWALRHVVRRAAIRMGAP
jgi:hypothetical protein